MTVRYETDGPVAVVTIDRPEVANAVDRPTAEALADAFRRFDSEEERIGRRPHRGQRHFLRGGGPEGDAGARGAAGESGRAGRRRSRRPNPDAPLKAGDRRRGGPCGRGRAGARRLVRSSGCGRGRGVRRLLPPLGHPVDGRRNDSARPAAGPQPCPGPDPHGPGRTRRGGASNGPGQPAGPFRRVAGGRPEARSRARLAASGGDAHRPPLLIRAVVDCRSTRPCRASTSTGCPRFAPGSCSPGWTATRRASGDDRRARHSCCRSCSASPTTGGRRTWPAMGTRPPRRAS